VALGAIAWVIATVATFAQTPVSDFGDVSTRVRIGDIVYVTDSAGREHKGMLFALSNSQLVLESGSHRVDFPSDRIAAIRWLAPDPLANGALIGMGVTAGLVGVAAFASCGPNDCGWAALVVLAYAGIGAGVGAGIDALIPGKKIPVYRAAGGKPGASLSLSPVLSARRKGVAAIVRF
jgi:hypothetical protein